MSDKQPSTLQAAYDQVTGLVQQGIASITGSSEDQAKANEQKAKGDAESDLSHSAVKVGPYTVSSSGAAAKDNTDRRQGQWDQTIGSTKETVGNLLGSENLKHQGREQNLQGQRQEAQGQLSDLGQGVSDRVQGTLGGAVAGLTGDREGQARYTDLHDEGKSRQRGVEADLDKKQAAAEAASH